MINMVKFQGKFSEIPTYSINHNAAPQKNGISSEALESLRNQLRDTYQHTQIECNPYDSPASLQITGTTHEVELADSFVNSLFARLHVHSSYTPKCKP